MKLIHVAVILGFIYLFNGISQANYELENPSDPKSVQMRESAEESKRISCKMVGDLQYYQHQFELEKTGKISEESLKEQEDHKLRCGSF